MNGFFVIDHIGWLFYKWISKELEDRPYHSSNNSTIIRQQQQTKRQWTQQYERKVFINIVRSEEHVLYGSHPIEKTKEDPSLPVADLLLDWIPLMDMMALYLGK